MERLTLAEFLLEQVAEPLGGRQVSIMSVQGMTPAMIELALARIKLGLEFQHKPMDFKLRAIVEEWDEGRLTREMY